MPWTVTNPTTITGPNWNPVSTVSVATNNGPAPVTGATVSDNMPGVLTGVTWSCAGTGGGSCAGLGAGNINDSTVNLPAGASVTYTVTGTIPYGTLGPINNTATVAVPAGVADNVTANNTSSTSTVVTDLIFADGFEAPDLTAWSSAQTDGTDLSLVHPGLASTATALRALVDDQAGIYVQDNSPSDENRYRARFYLDTSDFDPGEANGAFRTRVFLAFEEAPSRPLMAVVLKRQSSQYSILGRARKDDGSQADTGFFAITPGQHAIDIDWVRSTDADTPNGQFRLWIDGILKSTLTGVDNSASQVDFARLGALSIKAGASGTIRWDEFESRHENYIGPLP